MEKLDIMLNQDGKEFLKQVATEHLNELEAGNFSHFFDWYPYKTAMIIQLAAELGNLGVEPFCNASTDVIKFAVGLANRAKHSALGQLMSSRLLYTQGNAANTRDKVIADSLPIIKAFGLRICRFTRLHDGKIDYLINRPEDDVQMVMKYWIKDGYLPGGYKDLEEMK